MGAALGRAGDMALEVRQWPAEFGEAFWQQRADDVAQSSVSRSGGGEPRRFVRIQIEGPCDDSQNESALVPIVQIHIAAEKVSLWNNSLESQRPLRALWLTNSSPLTLDGGGFTVLEDEAFAGEGLTDPIKPGEKRLVSYAADLGVRVDAKSESRPQRVTRVRIWRGVMSMTREMQQTTTYTVRDDDTTPRTVLIEHPLRVGWKLAEGTPKPEETTSNVYRFRVSVKPKETSKLEVGESEPLDTRYEISNVTDNQITLS